MSRFYSSEDGNFVYSVKAISPINIALVKYWGKMEENLIIPANSSLSITIDSSHLRSETTVKLLEGQSGVSLVLNGKQDKVTDRILNVISKV